MKTFSVALSIFAINIALITNVARSFYGMLKFTGAKKRVPQRKSANTYWVLDYWIHNITPPFLCLLIAHFLEMHTFGLIAMGVYYLVNTLLPGIQIGFNLYTYSYPKKSF